MALDDQEELARLAAVRRLRVLDTPPEERFDKIVRVARAVFDVPVVAINLVDRDRQFTKAGAGMPVGDLPIARSLCAATVHGADTLVVGDTALDERFRGHPGIEGDPGIRFYAGEPLRSPDGYAVGALCLVDHQPRELNAAQSALLAELAGLVEGELAVDEQLLQARELQRRLIPRAVPDLDGLDVAGVCVPARDVGGDFYDWRVVDGQLQVIVADVMGKGLGAALIAAGVRAVFRTTGQFNPLPVAVGRLAASMQDDFDETDTFVTAFAARIDPRTGEIEYIDAGHGLGLVVPAEGEVRRLASRDLPLGALEGTRWASVHTHLEPGDTLVVVSDGLAEAFPDIDTAVQQAATLVRALPGSSEVVSRAHDLALDLPRADDMTLLVVRRPA